jgi:hypothetical protein
MSDTPSIVDQIRVIAAENPEDHKLFQAVNALYWAQAIGLVFGGQKFDIAEHEYQMACISDTHPNEVWKFSAQMGKTIDQMIKRMHHLIYNVYPQGVMYIFPTTKLVQRFSQARFTPLLNDNPILRLYIGSSDNMELKRVGRSNLYFVGSRMTQKIEGERKTSANLKSEPVDCVVEDEYDEIDQDMSVLAQHRMDHSKVKHRARISTPSMPDYGIDRAYQASDQSVWMIKCGACHTYTCLELEFPDCLHELADGSVIRACKKCHREIFPRDGIWVPQYPSRSEECQGRWISQLNSAFVKPKVILESFKSPPNDDVADFYNSTLGMAYISAENCLFPNDLYKTIKRDLVAPLEFDGPAAMGVDVGRELHVVILSKTSSASRRLIKFARVSTFNDVHDLGRKFGVKCAVLDLEPETRKVRDFIESEKYECYGCDYHEAQHGPVNWDSDRKVVTINRTEILDATHELVVQPGRLELPRLSDEMKDYLIPQLCSPAKILSDDDETGKRVYHYRKRGPDHYRHALNYAYMASMRIGIAVDKKKKPDRKDAYDSEDKPKGSWMGA